MVSRRPVPMLFSGSKRDHVADANSSHRLPLALRPALPGCDNQHLAERMSVPNSPGPGLERGMLNLDARGSDGLVQVVYPDGPCKQAGTASSRGLRTPFSDFHGFLQLRNPEDPDLDRPIAWATSCWLMSVCRTGWPITRRGGCSAHTARPNPVAEWGLKSKGSRIERSGETRVSLKSRSCYRRPIP